MSRIFESWWWTTIAVVAFVFWGGFFPSEPREQPRLFIVTYVALGLSIVMCVLTLVSWLLRVWRRAH